MTTFESQQLMKLDLNYEKYHQYPEFVMIKYRSLPALSSGSLTFFKSRLSRLCLGAKHRRAQWWHFWKWDEESTQACWQWTIGEKSISDSYWFELISNHNHITETCSSWYSPVLQLPIKPNILLWTSFEVSRNCTWERSTMRPSRAKTPAARAAGGLHPGILSFIWSFYIYGWSLKVFMILQLRCWWTLGRKKPCNPGQGRR